jgi:hypothetical protein
MEARSSDPNKSFTALKKKPLQVWFSKSMEAPTLLRVLQPENKTLQVWFKDLKHTPDQNQKEWGSNPRQVFLCYSCRRAIFLEARREPQAHNKTTKTKTNLLRLLKINRNSTEIGNSLQTFCLHLPSSINPKPSTPESLRNRH